MKKTLLLTLTILMLTTGTCFATSSPYVDFHKTVLSGVNFATTVQLSNGKIVYQSSSIFARLNANQPYVFVFNAELDHPISCEIVWLGEDATVWEPATEPVGEGRFDWTPHYSGLYAVRCTVALGISDWLGIVIEHK